MRQITENDFDALADLSFRKLLSNDVYQNDLRIAKSSMFLSLQYLQKDPEFLKGMLDFGLDYTNHNEEMITRMRDDIWERFLKIMNIAYYLCQTTEYASTEIS